MNRSLMEYAQTTHNSKLIWVGMNELAFMEDAAIQENVAVGPVVQDVVHTPEKYELTHKIVYGILLVNRDEDYEQSFQRLSESTNSFFSTICSNQCHTYRLVDLVVKQDSRLAKAHKIKFAAVINVPGDFSIQTGNRRLLTGFLRPQSSVDPVTDIYNRQGLILLTGQEDDPKEKWNGKGWKQYINLSRLNDSIKDL
ncbi:TPA: hypothetical protein KDZ97_003703 [Vibrio parahaemolyticus]|nr:hypothetical protein [Vibrio parahaemolyticus]HBC3815610.1 hypothetical protein [Vibrio parahaemolyticus]